MDNAIVHLLPKLILGSTFALLLLIAFVEFFPKLFEIKRVDGEPCPNPLHYFYAGISVLCVAAIALGSMALLIMLMTKWGQ